MAEKSGESTVGKYLGAPIGGALTALLTWLTAGSSALAPALISLVAVAGGLCGLALTLIYRRYLGILGADRRRPAERQAYDVLRNSLAEGNLATRLYTERLTRFLDWIDHFFGDAGMADRTLFPHAFGLRTLAPLWTAPAFDRCLLLAAIYPFSMIFVIWSVSGHVGPAEAALHLGRDLSGWQRALAACVVGLSGLVVFRFFSSEGWKSFLLWSALLALSFCGYRIVAIAGAGEISPAISGAEVGMLGIVLVVGLGIPGAVVLAGAVVAMASALGYKLVSILGLLLCLQLWQHS
jgi:hypothetical protein